MAGDWIKMRLDLATHPKVVRIMSATKSDKFRTLGGLHAVWGVFDHHTEDGVLHGYTPDLMDIAIGWEGFSEAMITVGWLEFDGDETLVMPDFDNHNGKSAKRRAEDSQRKRIRRSSEECPQNVRKMSANEKDKNGTREEKRREDIKAYVTSDDNAVNEAFEQAWQLYPKRSGSNPKNKAHQCWNARIKEGYSEQDLIAGVKRYASFCKYKQQVGTEFVMQASRFFGTGLEFENNWSAGGSLDNDDFQQQMAEIMKGAI